MQHSNPRFYTWYGRPERAPEVSTTIAKRVKSTVVATFTILKAIFRYTFSIACMTWRLVLTRILLF